MSTKQAKDLKPGDQIKGYTFPRSIYAGTVKSVATDKAGETRIGLEPSGHYFVPGWQPIQVIA